MFVKLPTKVEQHKRLRLLILNVWSKSILVSRTKFVINYRFSGREPPTVELYPSARQTVTLGGSVLFQCRATGGIPTPVIKWTRRNGESLPSQVEEIPPGVIKYVSVDC